MESQDSDPAIGVVKLASGDRLRRHLMRNLNNPELADVLFVVGKTETPLYAHSQLLGFQSAVFARMFSSEWKECRNEDGLMEVRITDADGDAFLELLRYIYSDSWRLTAENVLVLMNLCNKYELEEGKLECASFIQDSIKSHRVCQLLEAASLYGLGSLYDKCYAYIEDHTRKAFLSDGFFSLSARSLVAVLQSDRLMGLTEFELYKFVEKWIERHHKTEEEREAARREILPHVRFPLMKLSQLLEVDAKHRVPAELLKNAFRFLAASAAMSDAEMTQRKLNVGAMYSKRGDVSTPRKSFPHGSRQKFIEQTLIEFDAAHCSKDVSIGRGGRSARHDRSGWCSVLAKQSFNRGVHAWTLVISDSENGFIMIGVAVATADVEKGIHEAGNGGYALYCSNGNFYHQGKEIQYTEPCQVGDLITVVLNSTKGTISFLKNNKKLGTAFSGLQGIELHPAVSFHDYNDSVRVLDN